MNGHKFMQSFFETVRSDRSTKNPLEASAAIGNIYVYFLSVYIIYTYTCLFTIYI